MKRLILSFAGCMSLLGCREPQHVDFVYCNLSGKEIRVVDIAGMPSGVGPGFLIPAHDEDNPLEQASAILFEPISVADQLKIVWEEDTVERELQLKRKDLGLPSKLEDAKIRFTYWGGGKWRVTRLR